MRIARLLSVPLSLAFLGSAIAAQKPKDTQDEPQTVVTPAGEVRVLPASEARQVIARFKKLVLSRKARRKSKATGTGSGGGESFLTRLEEVEALARVQHKSLVPQLKKVMMTDPSDAVRIKAAESLLAQPKKEATRLAVQLLKERKFLQKGALAAPMIKIISFHGAKPDIWKDLRKRFLDMGDLGQQALLEHIGERKDWEQVDLILDNIDPPAPLNVDDPSNPPASYWKARWEQWRAFQPALKEACEKLFGRTFETRKDAELWIADKGGLRALKKK